MTDARPHHVIGALIASKTPEDLETARTRVVAALEAHSGALDPTANQLGASTRTLIRWLAALGLRDHAAKLRESAGLHDPKHGRSLAKGRPAKGA